MNIKYGGVYIPNLANDGEKFGIGQYRFPRNYELSGREFTVAADGKDYKLAFLCREKAVFEGRESEYECLKLEKDTYFVRFGSDVAVLDLDKNLATLVLGDTYIHGVIVCPEKKASDSCHTCAGDDMVGTKVRWILGPNKYVNHDYCAKDQVRAAWAKNTVLVGIGMKTFRDGWEPPAEQYDTLPCKATKIKEPMYLVDIKGGVQEGVCAPAGTSRVIMLQDYDHMMLVGCVFGDGFDPIMITGYAKFLN